MTASNLTPSPLGLVTTTDLLRDTYFNLVRHIQPTVCCDIGANDGQAAVRTRDAAPAARVIAFEANPQIHELHAENLAARRIEFLNMAINDRSGEVVVYAPRTLSKAWAGAGRIIDTAIKEPTETGKTSLLRRNEDATYTEFRVLGRSLDDFFASELEPTRENQFALWIDVEGAASAVLRGGEKTLRRTSLILVEVENYPFWREGTDAGEVAEFLQERGFIPIARDREYGDDQFNVLFARTELEGAAVDLLRAGAAGPVIYPRINLPVIIPSFNNPTYLRQMVGQVESVGFDQLIVVDNASDYPPHLAYLAEVTAKHTVVRERENRGPRQLFRDATLLHQLPPFFCVTDPDLVFNPRLPPDFIESLSALTVKHQVGKAGFALDISEPDRMISQSFQIGAEQHCIWEWEAQFWQTPLENEGNDPAYRALIDTTFAVYNKEFFRPDKYLEGIRVAGRFTARHLPWYADHSLPPEEAAHYRRTSRYSFYTGTPPPA